MEISYISESGNTYDLNKIIKNKFNILDKNYLKKIKTVLGKDFFRDIQVLDKNKLNCIAFPTLAMTVTPILPLAEEASKTNGVFSDLKKIADFCEAVTKFCSDVVWCVQNPVHTIVLVLEYFLPLFLMLASIIPLVGLIAIMLGSDTLLGKKCKNLVINPIILFVIYTLVILLIKHLWGIN